MKDGSWESTKGLAGEARKIVLSGITVFKVRRKTCQTALRLLPQKLAHIRHLRVEKANEAMYSATSQIPVNFKIKCKHPSANRDCVP
jgi:hypothetical protein